MLKAMYNPDQAEALQGREPVVGIQFLERSRKGSSASSTTKKRTSYSPCAGSLRTIVLTGIYTGLRVRAELFELRWDAVDFSRNHLTVYFYSAYAKNRESCSIPMNSLVREALLSHKRAAINADRQDAHVFLAWRGPRAGGATNARTAPGLGHGVPEG